MNKWRNITKYDIDGGRKEIETGNSIDQELRDGVFFIETAWCCIVGSLNI